MNISLIQSLNDSSVQEKIEKMWKRKVEERIDFNYMIQGTITSIIII